MPAVDQTAIGTRVILGDRLPKKITRLYVKISGVDGNHKTSHSRDEIILFKRPDGIVMDGIQSVKFSEIGWLPVFQWSVYLRTNGEVGIVKFSPTKDVEIEIKSKQMSLNAVKQAAQTLSGKIGNFVAYIVALRGREFEIGRAYDWENILGVGLVTEYQNIFQSNFPGKEIELQCQMQASNSLNGTLSFHSKDCGGDIIWRGSKYNFDMEIDIDYHLDSGIVASEKGKSTMHVKGHTILVEESKSYKLEY